MFKTIDKYTLKEFIKIFTYFVIGIFMLIFFINILEFSSSIEKYKIPLIDGIKITVYEIPLLLESILQFIILLSSIVTITKLSSTSELIAINASKYSLWNVIKCQVIFSICLAFFIVLLLNPLFINLKNKSNELKNKYINKTEYSLQPENGIWLKQQDKNNEIIIKAKNVNIKNLTFSNVILFLTDKEGNFTKKINADKMIYSNNSFILSNVEILENNNFVNKESLIISTNLKSNFI